MNQMLNDAGYEVFYADNMTCEQALYCFNLAKPRKQFKNWEAIRDYYLEPLMSGRYWPEDHPFAHLTTDQRDNAMEAIQFFKQRNMSAASVMKRLKASN